jgi:methyl-accepting chemotaxis protein
MKGSSSIKSIATQVGQNDERTEATGQQANNISKTVKNIEEIAFQTNLLALKAAVELAHAGLHGKDFAAVAEEVRSLAARSAEAATETAELSASVVSKTEPGAQAAEALQEIVSDIGKVTDLIAEISAFSSKQAEKILPIDGVARSSAATTDELTGRVERLCRTLRHLTLRHPNQVIGSHCSVTNSEQRCSQSSGQHGANQSLRIVLNDGTLVKFEDEN